ncbi:MULTISPECIES: hypothetical protein [Halomonadaceae]|uniref:hypothetical protein n=1 Tax=Halomonadaceae TaxID=28256 RepID=UPI00159910C6|nr:MULTISPECIES: hypothetical protein [Halomonas]QJQ93927.1 hypothetical protein HIO72_00525 [Halomonas sp. PA5]
MADNGPDTTVRSKPIMERHLQTMLLAIATMLIGWQGVTTFNLSQTSARQDERIVHLTQQVSEIHRELRDQRDNYVTFNEADRRFREHRHELDAINSRVRALEESR